MFLFLEAVPRLTLGAACGSTSAEACSCCFCCSSSSSTPFSSSSSSSFPLLSIPFFLLPLPPFFFHFLFFLFVLFSLYFLFFLLFFLFIFLVFYFILKITSLPSAPNSQLLWRTTISLMVSLIFMSFPAIAPDPQQSALFRLLCVTGHSWRTVKPLWYERFIQWQQNGSKAVMWQLYKILAIWGCPRRFYSIDSCLLHVSTPQPLHITPALQEACVWAIL